MSSEPLIYLNGDVVEAADARISPFDRGFLWGDGVYEITATATDSLENTSDSVALPLTVDTTMADTVVTGVSEDTGTAGDEITSDNTLEITGTAEAGSTVEVFLTPSGGDPTSLGTTLADESSGAWSIGPTAPIDDGVMQFRRRA